MTITPILTHPWVPELEKFGQRRIILMQIWGGNVYEHHGRCVKVTVTVLFKRPADIYGAAAAEPWPMLAPGTAPAGRGARLATLALT